MTVNKNVWRWANTLLLAGLLATVLTVLFFPVDVLKDNSWKLKVAGGDTHHTTDTLTISSTYIKVRKADGEAKRYLDCKVESGAFLRYDLTPPATANRTPGTKRKGTAIVAKIPPGIQPIPTTCKIAININYCIYRVGACLRTVSEYNESNEFKLEEAK